MGEKSAARRLLDFGVYGLILSVCIGTGYWLRGLLAFFLFKIIITGTAWRCLVTLPRDLSGIVLLITLKWKMRNAFNRNKPLHYYFLEWVERFPDKECLIEVETGRTLSFREVNQLSNKYANLFLEHGYKKGDVIGMFLENSADFFALWLGLSKLGVVTAWINSNLKLDPLAHSVNVANCTTIVTSNSLYPALKAAINQDLFANRLKIYAIDRVDDPGVIQLPAHLINPSEPPSRDEVTFKDVLCYIYTSGTTGNPKAAVIKHFRYYFVILASGRAFGMSSDDRVYVTMPMYHSAAGIIGVGHSIVRGCTVVIRKKFSASNFWKDAVKYDCTASQYIGEICRYLLNQKPSPDETKHRIRLMYGNGLRAEIWREFVRRFGIKRIGEFYGSTEGNSNIVNIDNTVGACGFFPIYPGIYRLYPVRLVKVDPETGELLRDKNGLCISCQPGDTGEMVGTIKKSDPLLDFEGYVNKTDTAKKVLKDVFRKGDYVFTSGDILHWDKHGYLYFKDRRGDTYRWRGENVSTTEVESVLQPISAIEDGTVFGVEVPGREGRCGMIGAKLMEGANLEEVLDELARNLSDKLATYAIPVFLRVCKQVDRTGTFKLKKTTLQKEGFNPANVNGDLLFYWEQSDRRYKPLDQRQYEDIVSGRYNKI